MERARWYAVEEKMPLTSGKYWVYPYRTLAGSVMVAMVHYKNGKWEETYSEQRIRFWKPIDVPKPPKIPRERSE
jgi:hypothetical protein